MKARIVFLSLLIPICQLASGEVFETIDAVVNNEPIFSSEIDQIIQERFTPEQIQAMSAEQLQRARSASLAIRINDMLIMQEVRRRLNPQQQEQIRHNVEELTNQVMNEAKKKITSAEMLASEERRAGLTWQEMWQIQYERQYREFINNNVIPPITRQLVTQPTPEELEQFQKDFPNEKPEGNISVAHVMLKVPEGATEEQEERIKTMAQAIADKAKAGEPFEGLVQQYSEHEASKANNGILTFKKGELYPEFDTLFSLDRNEITGPIRTQSGYHVIKMIRKRTLEDLVMERKWTQATREWIEGLRKKASIRVRQESGFEPLSSDNL